MVLTVIRLQCDTPADSVKLQQYEVYETAFHTANIIKTL